MAVLWIFESTTVTSDARMYHRVCRNKNVCFYNSIIHLCNKWKHIALQIRRRYEMETKSISKFFTPTNFPNIFEEYDRWNV